MMFGLTKREQRWKAEQEAAEAVFGFVASVARARADVLVAEAQASKDDELDRRQRFGEEIGYRQGQASRQREVDALHAQIERQAALLRQALVALSDAKQSIASWGGYASEYFQDKHDLQSDIDAPDKTIAAITKELE